MTIATCYVSPEGVVLGADSTSTINVPGVQHYYNHSQKVFAIGEQDIATLGAITWGLGGLFLSSHRLLFSRLADDIKQTPPQSVGEVCDRWIQQFWAEYQAAKTAGLKEPFDLYNNLAGKQPHLANQTSSPIMRTQEEEEQFQALSRNLLVGFCIGGYVLPDRRPQAWFVHFAPSDQAPQKAQQVPDYDPRFWGAPNYYLRLADGSDPSFRQEILASPFWSGTEQDLLNIAMKYALGHHLLPIRDAIDLVYTSISSTIKALKFSNLPQICGGPIEIAVITADRPFRWVRHKKFDAAIMDGGT